MSVQNFSIDDRELATYIHKFAFASKRISTQTAKALRIMTNYTEKQMKRYSRSSSSRSTGKLSSSITANYSINSNSVSSSVFVPSEIKYQFASEYGSRGGEIISGSPTMTFGTSSWRNSSAVKVPHRGYFVFTQVKRGKYAGKHFTKKAFEDLQNFYRSKISHKLAHDVAVVLGGR